MLLDFEQALSVAKIVNDEENGIMALTEFIFRPTKEEKEMSKHLANSLASGNELMQNTLYKTIIRNINILRCEKAYNMKG